MDTWHHKTVSSPISEGEVSSKILAGITKQLTKEMRTETFRKVPVNAICKRR
jgi:hypothetical protein